ncbi:hypothetical protein Tco_0002521 [Tanacetum coccineum]
MRNEFERCEIKGANLGGLGSECSRLVSSYEVLEGFWRGDVVAARKEQQGGDVASLVAKERNRGACKLLGEP